MELELFLLLNIAYEFIILRFVGHFIRSIRSLPFQLLACFGSSILLLMLPLNLFCIILSYLVYIVIAFPKRAIIRAIPFCLGVAIFLGGMLFIAADYFPRKNNAQLYLFLLLTILMLAVILRRWQKQKTELAQSKFVHQVELTFLNQTTLSLKGFVDTGNECVEPISGWPVHFLLMREVSYYLPMHIKQALFEWRAEMPYKLNMFPKELRTQIRFISLQTLNAKSNYVLAFRAEIRALTNQNEPCYIVLVQGEEVFPCNAQLLLQASTLINFKLEGGS